MHTQRSLNIFHVMEDTMRLLYSLRERVCEGETVMSLSKGFLPAVAVCLSAAVSPSGCFGRKEGGMEARMEGRREKYELTSCVRRSVCVCVEKEGLVVV